MSYFSALELGDNCVEWGESVDRPFIILEEKTGLGFQQVSREILFRSYWISSVCLKIRYANLMIKRVNYVLLSTPLKRRGLKMEEVYNITIMWMPVCDVWSIHCEIKCKRLKIEIYICACVRIKGNKFNW